MRASVSEVLLGARPVAAVMGRATATDLRVITYHEVQDVTRFERQLQWITRAYVPVDHHQVAAWAAGDLALPPRSVWITFDDGRADVVRGSAPLLRSLGVSATMFVCPGLVDPPTPYWWDIVHTAVIAGFAEWPTNGPSLVTALKQVSDDERRTTVDRLLSNLDAADVNLVTEHARHDDLRSWVAQGHAIGNHTWDHPCLDQCLPSAQQTQIERAHRWLRKEFPEQPLLFAYPNGDRTDAAEAVLKDLGYRVAALFDHRVHGRANDPLRLSRLRLDADATLRRARAVVSGAHSALFHGLRGGA